MSATNYSLYSWFVGIGVHWQAIFLSKRSKEMPFFDNVAPRDFHSKVRELAKTSKDAQKFLRLEAAQANIYENLGWYAGAVVAGTVARLPARYMNWFAGTYIASRVAYAYIYAVNTRKLSYLRSLTFLISVMFTTATYVKAGNAFNKVALY
ncbi:hypothetical protein JCM6882_008946 [Rhodosporidiobolus microsporus]